MLNFDSDKDLNRAIDFIIDSARNTSGKRPTREEIKDLLTHGIWLTPKEIATQDKLFKGDKPDDKAVLNQWRLWRDQLIRHKVDPEQYRRAQTSRGKTFLINYTEYRRWITTSYREYHAPKPISKT